MILEDSKYNFDMHIVIDIRTRGSNELPLKVEIVGNTTKSHAYFHAIHRHGEFTWIISYDDS